ncbi:unnamed protein product [Brassica oleracea]
MILKFRDIEPTMRTSIRPRAHKTNYVMRFKACLELQMKTLEKNSRLVIFNFILVILIRKHQWSFT